MHFFVVCAYQGDSSGSIIICLFGIHGTGSTTLNLDFNSETFVCDCLDYDIYKLLQGLFTHALALNNIYCGKPRELWNKKVNAKCAFESNINNFASLCAY